MLQLMREGCSYTYPPLSIARYWFIQLSELEQCRVKTLVQGFNAAAQDSNQDSRSRECEARPLSHRALQSHCALHLLLLCSKCSLYKRYTISMVGCIYDTFLEMMPPPRKYWIHVMLHKTCSNLLMNMLSSCRIICISSFVCKPSVTTYP